MHVKNGIYNDTNKHVSAVIVYKQKTFEVNKKYISYANIDYQLLASAERREKLNDSLKKELKWFIKSGQKTMDRLQAQLELSEEEYNKEIEIYSISTDNTRWYAKEVEYQHTCRDNSGVRLWNKETKEMTSTDIEWLHVSKITVRMYDYKIHDKVVIEIK